MRIWCMTNLAFNLFFQQHCFNVRDTFYSIITTIQFSVKNKTLYYWRYIDDIFVLFKSSDHLKQFQSYLNFCQVNISFTIETKQNNKISFLDVNVIREQDNFIASIYQKPTFSDVYTQFDSFLPETYKIGMIYTLVNRCFGHASAGQYSINN